MAAPAISWVTGPAAAPTVVLAMNPDDNNFVSAEDFVLGSPDWSAEPYSVGGAPGFRTCSFTMVTRGNWTTASAARQAVAKQLLAKENWLAVIPSSPNKPMFLHTFRVAQEALQWNESDFGVWKCKVTVVCDPYLYGVPVTGGPVTINNDPAAGTNPCFFRFTAAILGDAPTPLYLEAAAADMRGRNTAISSQALGGGLSQTAPVLLQNTALVSGTTTGGVAGSPPIAGTITNFTGDAAMSGGNYTRFNPGLGDQGWLTVLHGTNLLTSTLIGDYRVLVRVRSDDTAADWALRLVQTAGASNTFELYPGEQATYVRTTTGPHYVDLGVFRFPFGAPQLVSALDSPYGNPGLSFALQVNWLDYHTAGTDPTIDIDCLVFVPVGQDQAVSNTYGSTAYDKSLPAATYKGVWNGLTGARYLLDTSSNYSPGVIPYPSGGLPVLVPGADNTIHFFRHVGTGYNDPRTGGTTGTNDALADTTALSWKYFPLYLDIRSDAG